MKLDLISILAIVGWLIALGFIINHKYKRKMSSDVGDWVDHYALIPIAFGPHIVWLETVEKKVLYRVKQQVT